jgi:hypothetical protein
MKAQYRYSGFFILVSFKLGAPQYSKRAATLTGKQ